MFGAVSRRYAKALLSIGIDTQSADALGKELELAANTIAGSKDLRATLENPVFPAMIRRPILDEVSKRLALSKTVHSLLALLLERNRINVVGDVSRAYRALLDSHAGRIRAQVTTAAPLDDALANRLRAAFEKQSQKSVILEKKVDPTMLGGVVAQLGDMVYDGSVRNQLQTLRDRLLAE